MNPRIRFFFFGGFPLLLLLPELLGEFEACLRGGNPFEFEFMFSTPLSHLFGLHKTQPLSQGKTDVFMHRQHYEFRAEASAFFF